MKGSLKSVLKEDSPREVRQLLCECYLKNGEALPFSLLQNQLSCCVCYKQRREACIPWCWYSRRWALTRRLCLG